MNSTNLTDIDETVLLDALAAHFEIERDEDGDLAIEEQSYDHHGLKLYEIDGTEYAIGTDDEANSAVTDAIKQSLWAFNSDFLAEQTGLPEQVFSFREQLYEDANGALEVLVEKCADDGLEGFVDAAVGADGRGHHLAQYDGEEIEIHVGDEIIYAYRT